MSVLATTLLIIALIAGLFGFIGVAGISTEIPKILFGAFLILFVISLTLAKRGHADKAKAVPGVKDVL